MIFRIAGRLLHRILRSTKVVVSHLISVRSCSPKLVFLYRQLLRLCLTHFNCSFIKGSQLLGGADTEHWSWWHYSLFWLRLTLHELSQTVSKMILLLLLFLLAIQSTQTSRCGIVQEVQLYIMIVENSLDHHCEAFWRLEFRYSLTQLLDKSQVTWKSSQVLVNWLYNDPLTCDLTLN